jgi:putative tryptophan/tyrosine transport system substrate-binding protein
MNARDLLRLRGSHEAARVHHAARRRSDVPLAARAQQAAKLPSVGFLISGSPLSHGPWVAAFAQRLRDLGWIEGRTVAIEYRWAEGRSERFTEIAAEFVRLKVDVILAAGTPATAAAKQATSVIPIVFAGAGDPVGSGLVAGLARSGGNVTGLSSQQTDTSGKRLELLREVVPTLGRLAILANVDNPVALLDMRQVEATASNLALPVVTLEIRRSKDIAPAFAVLKDRPDALYVATDPLVLTNRHQYLGARCAPADYVRLSRVRRRGRSDVLWTKILGPVPTCRRLCRQDSARVKAGRHPD